MSNNIFDYVNAINSGKNIIRDSDNPELMEKGYNTFFTNKAFSYHLDTIMFANELNINNQCDNLMQFEYFLHSVRPKKRFAKWSKTIINEDVEILQEYYKFGYRKAVEALEVLTPEQIKTIKTKLYKGGRI